MVYRELCGDEFDPRYVTAVVTEGAVRARNAPDSHGAAAGEVQRTAREGRSEFNGASGGLAGRRRGVGEGGFPLFRNNSGPGSTTSASSYTSTGAGRRVPAGEAPHRDKKKATLFFY
ncbi:hypothetical protein EVAR_51626_1 [Eumeta japonica]|uniref:Uncharacterized protein n=1 Tax=Eumeta variegata TaxID=151549 RepID=A0A4C1YDW6_EUMVA|nr:hypothetical protein EVAR_51626_1 [Eumeta japonica]